MTNDTPSPNVEENTSASTDKNDSGRIDFVELAKSSFDLIGEMRSSQSQGFRWWAFLFPVGFLYSHGQDKTSYKAALVILIPTLVLSIAFYFLPLGLYSLGDFLLLVWTVYVAYMIATRAKQLVDDDSKADVGKGIIAQVVYLFVYSIIYYL